MNSEGSLLPLGFLDFAASNPFLSLKRCELSEMKTMKSIEKILRSKGVENLETMEINENYTIHNQGYHDLTVEKISPDCLSVAHYYTQRGDLMRDPEIVFRIIENGSWMAVEYRQDDCGIYQRDESGLDVSGFVKRWDKNLEKQGFVEAVQ
jgi:hypothetical protein